MMKSILDEDGAALTVLYIGPLIGLCFFAAGVILFLRAKKHARNLQTVRGTVRHNVRSDSFHTDSELFQMVVHYVVNGKTFHLRSRSSSSRKAIPGSEVTILCDPDNPKTAYLEEEYFLLSKALLMVGIGLLAFFSIFWLNRLFIGSI